MKNIMSNYWNDQIKIFSNIVNAFVIKLIINIQKILDYVCIYYINIFGISLFIEFFK